MTQDQAIVDALAVLDGAYLAVSNAQLEKKVDEALDFIIATGEIGVGRLLTRLYLHVIVSGSRMDAVSLGDYTYNEWLKKREIVRALARARVQSAVPKLIAFLGVSCNDVNFYQILQPAVVRALGEIGDKRAIAPLSKAHETGDVSPATRQVISEALEKLGVSEVKSQSFVGKTVEEAQRAAAMAGIPAERIYAQEVKCAVREGTVAGEGRSADEATKRAEMRIPPEAFDVRPAEIVRQGQQGMVEIRAQTEEQAREQWKAAKKPKGAQLQALECEAPPSNGFLGIGKRKQGLWKAHWFTTYKAQVRFKLPAEVTVTYGE